MNDDFSFKVKGSRPEELYKDVSDYFKGETLINYAKSKSMMRIQERITKRALELLELQKMDALILDAGCGPGFTSIYLRELGFEVVALDILPQFLQFYDLGYVNPIASDMCLSPFKPSRFDAIISISALQWIYRDKNNHKDQKSLITLVKCFSMILKPKGKIIFQFYPKNSEIMKDIGKIIFENTALNGNFIIDNPDNPKKRRIFLLLEKKEI